MGSGKILRGMAGFLSGKSLSYSRLVLGLQEEVGACVPCHVCQGQIFVQLLEVGV